MNHNSILQLADLRRSNSSQLWIAGCSFAHGSCVEKHERFGHILSEKLNLPVSFLTAPGSSIEWAADQILRSDIKKDDIVVWGLTGASRMPWFNTNNQLDHITLFSFEQNRELDFFVNKEYLASPHIIYQAITHVKQVENYLAKLACRFILAAMPANGPESDLLMYEFLHPLDYAIIMYDTHDYTFVDYGWDKLHPGPKQHRIYANMILNKLYAENSVF